MADVGGGGGGGVHLKDENEINHGNYLKVPNTDKSTWLEFTVALYVRTTVASVQSTQIEAPCQNSVCCFDPAADWLAVDGCPTLLSHGKKDGSGCSVFMRLCVCVPFILFFLFNEG